MIYCYYLWQNWWGLIGQSLLAFFSLAASKVISKASVFTSLLCGLGRLKGLESESRSVVSDSLRPHGLYSLWSSPGQTTGMGSLSLLQGIFPTQRLNPGLPHFRQILYQLSHSTWSQTCAWIPQCSESQKQRQPVVSHEQTQGLTVVSDRIFQ